MVDTSAILTQNLPPVQNPLNTIGTLQGLQLQQQQIANARQTNQNMQLDNQTGQQSLATTRANRASQILYGLSNLPDSQLAGGTPLRAALDRELQEGTIDQNTHDTISGALPAPNGPDGKPTPGGAYRPFLNSMLIGTLGGPQAIQAVTGSPVQIDNGQKIKGGLQTGPLGQNPGGFRIQDSDIQKTTSPETNAALNKIWDPNLRTFVPVPRSSLPGASGIPGNGGYAPNNGSAQNAPTPNAPTGQAPIMAQPPMGTAENILANQKQYQNDLADIPESQQRITNLQEAHRALSDLAQDSPNSLGVGADKMNEMKQILIKLGIGTADTLKNVNNYAEANKYFMQNAANLPSARSDASLATTLAGSPSTSIPPGAALDITKQVIGRERQRIAQAMNAPDKSGVGYQNYSANFANSNDRRAFAWDMYTPTQQQQILSSLKGNDLVKFQRSLGVASRLGMINSTPAPVPQPTAPTAPVPNNPLVYPRGT